MLAITLPVHLSNKASSRASERSLPRRCYTPESMIVYDAKYGSAPQTAELSTPINFTNPPYSYGQQIRVIERTIYAYQVLGAARRISDKFPGHLRIELRHGPGVCKRRLRAGIWTNWYLCTNQHFVDRVNYFDTIYTGAGIAQPDLIARGAVYGQMLGFEAVMTQAWGRARTPNKHRPKMRPGRKLERPRFNQRGLCARGTRCDRSLHPRHFQIGVPCVEQTVSYSSHSINTSLPSQLSTS
jgi:hypothetical protein